MSEKPESDEFEEEDAEDIAPGGDDVDVDHIMRDVESQRRRPRRRRGPGPRGRRRDRSGRRRRNSANQEETQEEPLSGAAAPPPALCDTGRMSPLDEYSQRLTLREQSKVRW